MAHIFFIKFSEKYSQISKNLKKSYKIQKYPTCDM